MAYKKNDLEIIEKFDGDTLFLFNLSEGNLVKLNASAKILWQRSKDPFVLDDLKRIIQENCNLPKNVNLDNDLNDFIKSLKKNNLIL